MTVSVEMSVYFFKNITDKMAKIRKVEAELSKLYKLDNYQEHAFDLELSHIVDCRLVELEARLENAKRSIEMSGIE